MADHRGSSEPVWLREWAYTPLTILYVSAVAAAVLVLLSVAAYFLVLAF